MLSIIISSYQKQFYNQLVENIACSIGVDFNYEIIQIWNPNLMSITAAYNLGEEKSKYENLLFLHEDVLFHTKNWGQILVNHLQFENTGIIGMAGSSYVPIAPCSWTVAPDYDFVNIIQGNKKQSESFKIATFCENRNKVFAVDGVFLAIKKEKFELFKFNEALTGFHGYDLDFSLRVSKKLQNFVIGDILIEHFSQGSLDQVWLNSNVNIKLNLGSNFNHKKDSEIEKTTFLGFLHNYFIYYPINLKSIFFTLKFYPFKHLKLKDHLAILKKYYYFSRYSRTINKKLK